MKNEITLQFHDKVIKDASEFVLQSINAFPPQDVLNIDLHCHDYNSNIPDEQLGRILNVPETWLPTERLVSTLKKHGMDAITVTNHNNARSCFELLDKGIDVLVGAEFTCTVPDFQISIHVLCYGFNPSQEAKLCKLRKNLYSFLEFTEANDLPTIWAHPLYNYKNTGIISPDFYQKMAVIFERFEVFNGQRDTWQNLLVKKWIDTLDKNTIDEYAAKYSMKPGWFCKNPYRKVMSGGSDSHMGIFSGLTCSKLYVPNLEEKRKTNLLSELALEAIREGRMVPYGGHHNSEKMMITFLDYFCQIALYGKDPGLLHVLLHKGGTKDKFNSFLIANGFAELRRHKVTMKFINLFHQSITGIEPNFASRWLVPKDYKPIFDQAKKMAQTFRKKPNELAQIYNDAIGNIFSMLTGILNSRITNKLNQLKQNGFSFEPDLNKLLSNFEIPAELRNYSSKFKKVANRNNPNANITGFLDGLPFPLLASSIILGAHFTSAHYLYKSRPLLNEFSKLLKYLEHPKRMLWLTDTWNDNNGVSTVLKSVLKEIRERDLPIDIMVCSTELKSEDHLVVVNPVSELSIPFYKEQKMRVPNYLEIHHKFLEGEYDRVMCSTEGPMGFAALYLKHAYTVPAFIYLHTDWITFGKKILKLEKENQHRFRRFLRAYYKSFDAAFVLNTDHYNWLIDKKMEINKAKVHITAHWADQHFRPLEPVKSEVFLIDENRPVMLYAGRLSLEKGVMELPAIYNEVKQIIPEIKLVIAGTGPDESILKNAIPDAKFLGWVNPLKLPAIYSSSDLLILPSKFDTFSCSVIEALSCGLPVIAYNTKGPKDIIQNGTNGILVSSIDEMISKIIYFFNNLEQLKIMKDAAIMRSKEYNTDTILQQLLIDTGLNDIKN